MRTRTLDFMNTLSAQVSQRLCRLPWAAAIATRLRSEIRTEIARGVTIPGVNELSGWAHNFTCSRCAQRYPFDVLVRGPFTCPSCRNVDDGVDHREAWVYGLNLYQITTANTACLVAQCEGDSPLRAACIAYARDVLLGYAQRYREWPVHGRWAGKGRLQGQCLDEAVWFLQAIEVYDALIALGFLSVAEQTLVQQACFLPAVELLQPQIHAVHNIHVWMAVAVAALATRLADRTTQAAAEAHLLRNLTEGVLPDGSWYECAPHYHYYTLEALFAYVAAGRRCNENPIGETIIRRMCRAPLALMRPDGQIALLNDGWPEHHLRDRAAIYETADGLFGGMGDILAEIYVHLGGARTSVEALRFGPDQVATDQRLFTPRLQVADGVAVVRRGGLMALVKANPDGGGHDHPDKPALDLHFLDGSLHAGDMGNPGYGNPLHSQWFKRSAAHNSVILDGQDQTRAAGSILEATECKGLTLVRAENTGAYPGTRIRRTVVVGDGWVMDVVIVTSEQPRTATWCFHAQAQLRHQFQTMPDTFLDQPHLTDQRVLFTTGATTDVAWSTPGGSRLACRVWQPRGQGQRMGTGRGPALPATESVDLLLVQARGTCVVFVACLAIGTLPEVSMLQDTISIAGHRLTVADDGTVAMSHE